MDPPLTAPTSPLAFHEAASIGRRENQEDSSTIRLLDDGAALLLVVADGMGGHEGGEIASGLAIQTFADCFEFNTTGELPKRLKLALLMANEVLAEQVRLDPELDGMGTTLVAAHISEAGLHWVSVGDSLLLLCRQGEIQRLNQDHSMAPVIERRFQAGKITREQADNDPDRNMLLAVLTGLNSPDMMDCPNSAYPLLAGDQIIVASDGLQSLSMDEITAVLGKGLSPQVCVEALLRDVAGKADPQQDNTTVQLALRR